MKPPLEKYCYRLKSSEHFEGEYDTFEDMAKELGDEFLVVNVGKYGSPPPMPTGDDLMFYFAEYMEDDVFDYCAGDCKELARRLQSVLDDFFTEFPIDYTLVNAEGLSEEEKIELQQVREKVSL